MPVVETTAEDQPIRAGKYAQPGTRRTETNRPSDNRRSTDRRKQENNSNMAMIAIVAILLLAIVVVCVFIAVRVMDRSDAPDTTSGITTTAPTTNTIACTGITLQDQTMENLKFTAKTDSALLLVKALPENTTEDVVCTFVSGDPTVAIVDNKGNVTPVSNGNTTITVSYKAYQITVNVTCQLAEAPAKLVLAYEDVTMGANNKTLNLYHGTMDPSEIQWTSSDEAVATVNNGVVTALKDGKTTITATYGEQKATCIIRVSGLEKEEKAVYALHGGWNYTNDVTLKLGSDNTFTLTLRNKTTGEVIKGLTWNVGDDFAKCCTKVETADGGVKITATSAGTVKIWTEYEGQKYECTIRIKTGK